MNSKQTTKEKEAKKMAPHRKCEDQENQKKEVKLSPPIIAKVPLIGLKSEKLSDKAYRGLAYLASCSKNFHITLNSFRAVLGWGRETASKAMRELINAGFLYRPVSHEGGQLVYDYILSEEVRKSRWIAVDVNIVRDKLLNNAAFRALIFIKSCASEFKVSRYSFKHFFSWGKRKIQGVTNELKRRGLLVIREVRSKKGEFSFFYQTPELSEGLDSSDFTVTPFAVGSLTAGSDPGYLSILERSSIESRLCVEEGSTPDSCLSSSRFVAESDLDQEFARKENSLAGVASDERFAESPSDQPENFDYWESHSFQPEDFDCAEESQQPTDQPDKISFSSGFSEGFSQTQEIVFEGSFSGAGCGCASKEIALQVDSLGIVPDADLVALLEPADEIVLDAIAATAEVKQSNRLGSAIAFLKAAIRKGYKPQKKKQVEQNGENEMSNWKEIQLEDGTLVRVPQAIKLDPRLGIGAVGGSAAIKARRERKSNAWYENPEFIDPRTGHPEYVEPTTGKLRKSFLDYMAMQQLNDSKWMAQQSGRSFEKAVGILTSLYLKDVERLEIDWKVYKNIMNGQFGNLVFGVTQLGKELSTEEKKKMVAHRAAFEYQDSDTRETYVKAAYALTTNQGMNLPEEVVEAMADHLIESVQNILSGKAATAPTVNALPAEITRVQSIKANSDRPSLEEMNERFSKGQHKQTVRGQIKRHPEWGYAIEGNRVVLKSTVSSTVLSTESSTEEILGF